MILRVLHINCMLTSSSFMQVTKQRIGSYCSWRSSAMLWKRDKVENENKYLNKRHKMSVLIWMQIYKYFENFTARLEHGIYSQASIKLALDVHTWQVKRVLYICITDYNFCKNLLKTQILRYLKYPTAFRDTKAKAKQLLFKQPNSQWRWLHLFHHHGLSEWQWSRQSSFLQVTAN